MGHTAPRFDEADRPKVQYEAEDLRIRKKKPQPTNHDNALILSKHQWKRLLSSKKEFFKVINEMDDNVMDHESTIDTIHVPGLDMEADLKMRYPGKFDGPDEDYAEFETF